MLFDLVRVHAIATLFLLHCAAIGFGLLTPLSLWDSPDTPNSNRYLKWFFAISIGCLANILVLFVLGIAGWFSYSAIFGAGLACLLMALPFTLKQAQTLHIFRGVCTRQAILGGLIVLVLLFTVLIVAFHPPGHWDDTMYHLPLARGYLQHNAIVLNEYLRFPLFPQNIDLLLALGLMLGGDLMAQAFASLPLFIVGLGLMGASRWLMGSPFMGVIASVVLFTLGPIKSSLGYAYIDNGLALFCWGAALAFALWAGKGRERPSYAWIIVAGMMAGGAAGSKYFGGVFAVLLGAYLVVARRDWKASLVYGVAVLLSGIWWYVRSFLISGDPLHPAGAELFGFFLWNAGDLEWQKVEQATHSVSANPLYLWAVLKEANVIVWILAFAGFVFKRVPAPIRLLQLSFLTYFIFWFFVTQVARYLAPVCAVATFLSCYTLYRCYVLMPAITRANFLRKRATAAGYLLLALLTFYAADRFYKYNKEMAQWNMILERQPGYELFTQANTLIPKFGPRLVQLGFENATYFFDGVVIGDWFGPGRYRNMLNYQTGPDLCHPVGAELLKKQLSKFGSRMLAVSTALCPDFDPNNYAEYFELVKRTDDGVLLILK